MQPGSTLRAPARCSSQRRSSVRVGPSAHGSDGSRIGGAFSAATEPIPRRSREVRRTLDLPGVGQPPGELPHRAARRPGHGLDRPVVVGGREGSERPPEPRRRLPAVCDLRVHAPLAEPEPVRLRYELGEGIERTCEAGNDVEPALEVRERLHHRKGDVRVEHLGHEPVAVELGTALDDRHRVGRPERVRPPAGGRTVHEHVQEEVGRIEHRRLGIADRQWRGAREERFVVDHAVARTHERRMQVPVHVELLAAGTAVVDLTPSADMVLCEGRARRPPRGVERAHRDVDVTRVDQDVHVDHRTQRRRLVIGEREGDALQHHQLDARGAQPVDHWTEPGDPRLVLPRRNVVGVTQDSPVDEVGRRLLAPHAVLDQRQQSPWLAVQDLVEGVPPAQCGPAPCGAAVAAQRSDEQLVLQRREREGRVRGHHATCTGAHGSSPATNRSRRSPVVTAPSRSSSNWGRPHATARMIASCSAFAGGTASSTTTVANPDARSISARGRWSDTDESGTSTAGTRERRIAATVLYPARLIESSAPSSHEPNDCENSWTTTPSPADAASVGRSGCGGFGGANTCSDMGGIAVDATSASNDSTTATRNAVASNPPALATAYGPSESADPRTTGSTTRPLYRTGIAIRSVAGKWSPNVVMRGSACTITASNDVRRRSTSST